MKNLIRTVTVAATLVAGIVTAQARSSESSLSREAHRLIDYSNQLTCEVNRHFRHSSGYRHLIHDAEEIREEAEHIDKLSHRVRGIDDVRHLRDDLEELDELVHHVAEVIEDIDRGRGRGHTHGDTRHVERLVACMNRSLHSMERMVKDMDRRCRHGSGRRASYGYRHEREVIYVRPSLRSQIAGHVLRRVYHHR
ncbi:MAG: hypothetical protein ACR2RV_18360 [Verrucomicrobiales bacterium]